MKAVIDVDFGNRVLQGSTELTVTPQIKDLTTLRINCRQLEILSVSIDAVICKFDYRDSIKDPLGQLSAGSVSSHQELKQKWAHATANDDEGELWITIPEGMIQQASVRQHVDEVAARIIIPKETLVQ
ncbi:hypothetical protein BG006_006502 [Podila minutissima]|uniref:Uncharacterized protein n=1 Tax=Podila minutissima TaxID=64525 RepID=A0A9P5VQ94_9FUNG|nr:hypothetical protein BG006_006502 [Podila minutissima]